MNGLLIRNQISRSGLHLQLREFLFQIHTGVAFRIVGHFFGGALANDITAAGSAFRPQINDVICYLDNIHVVLDDQYCVAPINQFLQHV